MENADFPSLLEHGAPLDKISRNKIPARVLVFVRRLYYDEPAMAWFSFFIQQVISNLIVSIMSESGLFLVVNGTAVSEDNYG